MILKEAYRYQNYLDALLGSIESFLRNTANVVVITETHMRSKVRPDAEDEIKSSSDEREINVKVDDLIDFACLVIDEKERLSLAIEVAKRIGCPNMDMSIAMNKVRQSFAESLKRMAAIKNRDWVKPGSGYCFNAEGNQVAYTYNVKYESKIDFTCKKVKDVLNGLATVSDEVSNRADYYINSVNVEFAPKFNINDTFEELAEQLSEYGIGMAS